MLALAVWVVKVPAMMSRQGLRLGPVRLTVYGAFAAAGVITAMALSGRVARRVGLRADDTWDAGLFAILSCFVASRFLLVLTDPVAFARYPLLVLGLPSLTIAGIALAAGMTWAYLRRKGLPVVSLLDVFAPCGAVLGAFLELGHWMDGSELGMPVFRSSASVAFRPVSLYGVASALAIAILLWVSVSRVKRPGQTAALALMMGGLAAFLLDLLSLPSDLFDNFWLEPGQAVALGAMLAGAGLWTFGPARMTIGRSLESAKTSSFRSPRRDLEHPLCETEHAVVARQEEAR